MDAKKITLEQLIARKEQGQRDKMAYKEIEIDILDGKLTVKRLPLTTVLNMLDNMGENAKTSNSIEFSKELIYKSCPLFQDKKLQSVYAEEISEPYDIVTVIFDDNVGVINDVTGKILAFYGLSEADKEIKN